jgi:hypothetical protein
VPHPTDESDANTLPDPELNPLLNPLLAAHMGRWAEVYFTNPPEKRGQAISELLRELENVAPPPPAVQVIPDEEWKRKAETEWSTSANQPVRTCSACAHNNSAGQRFCGMCGAPLQIVPDAHEPQVAEPAPTNGASWSKHELAASPSPVKYSSSTAAGEPHDPAPTWLPEKDFSALSVDVERVPRLRLYVGVVLAILLAMLLYMAWRGEGGPSVTAPQSVPARANPPAQPTPAPSAQQAGATGSALPKHNPTTSPVQNQSKASSTNDQAAGMLPVSRIVTESAGSSAIAAEPSGVEELATAEKYLKGNQGTARDSGEAAQWLWKAVGKGNLAATMALSDLYLRGDGVPKSCDQARLLLDAAARKGGKAAAAQLRNLQAFGCE